MEVLYIFMLRRGSCHEDEETAVRGLARENFQECIFNRDGIHRFVLTNHILPDQLKETMEICIKIVNHITRSALNSRIFIIICGDLDKHILILYNTMKSVI